MRVRLGVTFRSVFYAPYYVALHRGLFAHEGVELEAETFGDGRLVTAKLEAGELDAGIGGIMRSLVSFDRGATSVPVHFARINDRDGFFLLGRTEPFDWPDLLGRRLILFAEAPTPWYVLRAHLRDRGLNPDRIHVIADYPTDRAEAAFRGGEADFLEAPAHVAEALARDGAAVILRAMGEQTGPLPYSSYCAPPAVLRGRPELIAAVVRAHVAALRWMQTATGDEIWETIRPSFADGDAEVLRRAVERYRRLGTWAADATLPRDRFDRLAGMLQRGGLVARIAPYELVCDDAVAREATAAMP